GLAAALAVAASFGGALAIHAQDKREPLDLGTRRWLAHLTTDKPLYRPGEVVYARAALLDAFSRVPADGSSWANFQVRSPRGDEVHRSEVTLDQDGRCTVTFSLPGQVKDGEGTLALVVRDGGVQETAAKTIPIVVNRVKLSLFPEGGDLVQGVENRIYFEART